MDIAYLKQKYGDRLCLCGNINLAYTADARHAEDVDAEVEQRIHHVAPGGGYCVGSSNTVTEYVPLANYKAMRERNPEVWPLSDKSSEGLISEEGRWQGVGLPSQDERGTGRHDEVRLRDRPRRKATAR